jgi:hypothetical protein
MKPYLQVRLANVCLTDYITQRPWEETITMGSMRVDERLIAKRGRPLRVSDPEPTFSDSEVITISWIIETYFQGHEEVGYAFVCQCLRHLFPDLMDVEHFDDRRRDLIAVIETIRRDLRDHKRDRAAPVRLVDSAPLTLMTYTRGARCQSFVGNQFLGVVTSKRNQLSYNLTVCQSYLILVCAAR